MPCNAYRADWCLGLLCPFRYAVRLSGVLVEFRFNV
jgi:hypothetical protein